MLPTTKRGRPRKLRAIRNLKIADMTDEERAHVRAQTRARVKNLATRRALEASALGTL